MASENCGEYLSIDETMLHEDLFTILSNKGGHGRKGTIIAMVRGTKTSEIVNVLMNLPEDKRAAVKEVTMDLSDSMYGAIQDAFPQATIVMDLFHVIKCCNSAVEILRMEAKRDAMKQRRDEYKKFKQKLARRRKNHKTKKRDRRGAPRKRINEQFHPTKLGNDETRVDLLTRSRLIRSAESFVINQSHGRLRRFALSYGWNKSIRRMDYQTCNSPKISFSDVKKRY